MKFENSYIKRLQSRATRRGVRATMDQCREVYRSIVKEWESPLGTEMSEALEALILKTNLPQSQEEETPADVLTVVSEAQPLEIETPKITEITPESNPDIWEILQPPAEELASTDTSADELASTDTPLPEFTEDSKAIAPVQSEPTSLDESALVASQPNNQQLSTLPVPQEHIEGLVNQAFGSQSDGFKEKVTDYALQQSFADVRQVQSFLEELRSMEFDILTQTLQDHFKRRDSLVLVVDAVLNAQGTREEERRQNFTQGTRNRLAQFKAEMTAKLSKTAI